MTSQTIFHFKIFFSSFVNSLGNTEKRVNVINVMKFLFVCYYDLGCNSGACNSWQVCFRKALTEKWREKKKYSNLKCLVGGRKCRNQIIYISFLLNLTHVQNIAVTMTGMTGMTGV